MGISHHSVSHYIVRLRWLLCNGTDGKARQHQRPVCRRKFTFEFHLSEWKNLYPCQETVVMNADNLVFCLRSLLHLPDADYVVDGAKHKDNHNIRTLTCTKRIMQLLSRRWPGPLDRDLALPSHSGVNNAIPALCFGLHMDFLASISTIAPHTQRVSAPEC